MTAHQNGAWTHTLPNQADAVAYLTARGFSVGRMQGPERRGILFGQVDIMKWRNLSRQDIAVLHGVLRVNPASRTATIIIFANAPAEAHAAVIKHTDDGRLDE